MFMNRHLFRCAPLSQFYEGLVHGDANQPSREPRIFPKVSQVSEGFQEGLLNGIFGIFPIMCDALCNAKECAIVPPYELLESGYISVACRVDEIEVIP